MLQLLRCKRDLDRLTQEYRHLKARHDILEGQLQQCNARHDRAVALAALYRDGLGKIALKGCIGNVLGQGCGRCPECLATETLKEGEQMR